MHDSWKRGFTHLPAHSCVLGFFLPFLVWTPLVRFVRGLGDTGGELRPYQKIYVFYRAPAVKYTGTCISLFLFMLLYSYVALFSFRFVGWETIICTSQQQQQSMLNLPDGSIKSPSCLSTAGSPS